MTETANAPCIDEQLLGSNGASATEAGNWFAMPDGEKYITVQFTPESSVDDDITIGLQVANGRQSSSSPVTVTTKKGSDGDCFYSFRTCATYVRANVTNYKTDGNGSHAWLNVGKSK